MEAPSHYTSLERSTAQESCTNTKFDANEPSQLPKQLELEKTCLCQQNLVPGDTEEDVESTYIAGHGYRHISRIQSSLEKNTGHTLTRSQSRPRCRDEQQFYDSNGRAGIIRERLDDLAYEYEDTLANIGLSDPAQPHSSSSVDKLRDVYMERRAEMEAELRLVEDEAAKLMARCIAHGIRPRLPQAR